LVKQIIEERRHGVRAKRILSVQFRLAKGKGKKPEKNWHLSTTNDMSIVGLLFMSDVMYSVGDTLDVKIVMSGVLDIYCGLAKVIRTEQKKGAAFVLTGVKFLNGRTATRKAKAYSSTRKSQIAKAKKKK